LNDGSILILIDPEYIGNSLYHIQPLIRKLTRGVD